jgi:hypothetical protein
LIGAGGSFLGIGTDVGGLGSYLLLEVY